MGWLVVDVLQLERLPIDNVLTSNHHLFMYLQLVGNSICIILPLRRRFVEFCKVVAKNVVYVGDPTNNEDEALIYGNDCGLDPIDWQRGKLVPLLCECVEDQALFYSSRDVCAIYA